MTGCCSAPRSRICYASVAANVDSFDYSCVATGQVFVAQSWLSDELLRALRADVRALIRSGAVPASDEPIGKRLKLELDTRDWSVPGEKQPSRARAFARERFNLLRAELEQVIGRRLFLDELGSQAKYSVGKLGEPIQLHVDQRHEALGDRFYDQERTRRSLAWLLYLSDEGWDERGGSGSGGVLRAYPRRDCTSKCGAHEGNLQVGWLQRGQNGAEPVFLSCWEVPKRMEGSTLADLRRELATRYDDQGELWSALYEVQPAYQLYTVGANGQRENLSPAYETPVRDESGRLPDSNSNGALTLPVTLTVGLSPLSPPPHSGDFVEPVPTLREMLPEDLRASFCSTLSEPPKHQLVEVSPAGGTLVVFDSVVVPHEVSPVVSGERLALFGFFAEERPIPKVWADPEGAASVCGPWFPSHWAHTDC